MPKTRYAEPYIEPVPIQDAFFTHIVRTDIIGDNVRFVLAVEEDGQLIVVGKVIAPLANLPPMTAHCLQLSREFEARKSGGGSVPLHH
jgi:hypothetical protein